MPRGRPRLAEEYVALNVYLYERHHDWLRRSRRSRSEVIRNLIDSAIEAEKERSSELVVLGLDVEEKWR